MKGKNKYKIMFGKVVTQREFSNLQIESKPLKPASMSKLLGKRNWDLKQIPNLECSDKLSINQSKRKKKKILTTSTSSLKNRVESSEILTQQEDLQTPHENLPNVGEKSGENRTMESKLNEMLEIGNSELSELPNAENFEDYLAYDLRKKSIF